MSIQEEIEFWKKLALRAQCGCLYKDCALHGSYVGEDSDQLMEERKKFLEKENRRLESIQHNRRWAIHNNRVVGFDLPE